MLISFDQFSDGTSLSNYDTVLLLKFCGGFLSFSAVLLLLLLFAYVFRVRFQIK